MPTTRSSFSSGVAAGARFAPSEDFVGAFLAVLGVAAGPVFFVPDGRFFDVFAGVDSLTEDAAFFFFVVRFDLPLDSADVDFLATIFETRH
jgi:hypothetical protein